MRPWMRWLFAAIFIVTLVCSAPAGEGRTIAVGLSRSPASLPVLRIIDAAMLGSEVEFTVDVWAAPEHLLAMAQSGGHDLFTLPLTLAATLHNRGVPIRMTNVNTWGGMYFVTADPDFRRWEDAAGKTVFVPPRGSPPEVLSRFFLERAGLRIGGDVEIVNLPALEIAQLVRLGRIRHAVLLEPQATLARADGGVRAALSLEEEWRRVWGGDAGLPNLGFGGTAAFVDANPDFVRAFEQAYAEAAAWVTEHPEEAGQLAERRLGLPARAVAEAMPRLGLRYRPAADARADMERLYRVFLEHSPHSIGGAVPDETLYWR